MYSRFDVTILGNSSATPTKDRDPSSQYVRLGPHSILLDCGEGTQSRIHEFGLKLQKISVICISHLHGDHFFGLPGLITTMSLYRRIDPLLIIGPEGLQEILMSLIAAGDSELSFNIDFLTTQTNQSEVIFKHQDFQIQTVPLNHRIPCTGFIIKELGPIRRVNVDACQERNIPISFYESLKFGYDYFPNNELRIPNSEVTWPLPEKRFYAYISDTKYDEDIIPLISGADLLYHEATFMSDKQDRATDTFHSTAKQAAIIAKKANVGQLLLGHYSARYSDLTPLLEEAKCEFFDSELSLQGETYSVAKDELKITK